MKYSIRVRKKDSGYQFIITYKDGTWKTKSTQGFKKSQDAKDAARKAVLDLEKIVDKKIVPDSTETTFKKFREMYIEDIKIRCEPNTEIAYSQALRKFSDLDNIPMIKITNIEIQGSINKIIKSGISPSAIHKYFSVLKIVFKTAKDDFGLLCDLPTEVVKLPKIKDKVEIKVLSEDEEAKLLKEFTGTKYYLFIYVGLKCGLRIGETMGLTWDDLDRENMCIKIRHQWKKNKNGVYSLGQVKSKHSVRIIPVSKSVMAQINAVGEIGSENRLTNFNSTHSIDTMLNRMLKKKGFDITVHALRHTFATRLIFKGVDFKTVAKLMGHTVAQTIKTYSHVSDDMWNKAAKILRENTE